MKAWGKTFLLAVYAGIFIGIAGTVFLSVPNSSFGAFLFGFGLLTIVCFRFKLFTGAIGYLALKSGRQALPYLLSLSAIWLGNLTGCFAVGASVRASRIFPAIAARTAMLCSVKLADSPASLLILAFFCGILMFVAVETFSKTELPGFVRGMMLFLCVMVFILSGFEHSIAGMFYFSVGGIWNLDALRCIALMTLGNSLGGLLIPVFWRVGGRETAERISRA